MKKREERTPFESHTNMCMTNSALGEELEKTLSGILLLHLHDAITLYCNKGVMPNYHVLLALLSQLTFVIHSPLCRLQWRVTAVMLADTLERYKEQEKFLIFNFKRLRNEFYHGIAEDDSHDSLVHWVDRFSPRRYFFCQMLCLHTVFF
jgi:hypothetical protein